VPRPTLAGPRNVFIKVSAAGVNRADAAQRRGHYPPPKGGCEVMGLEVSGVVEQVGPEVKNFKEGDKVMGLLPGGGYAEYAVAHEGSVMHIPQGYSFIEAAAIPEAFLTAWQALKFHGDVRKGQHVLIHAGASGVGTAASQVVEKYFEATAVTTSSEGKIDVCKSFASINLSRTADETGMCFAPKIKNLLGQGAIDVVLDSVFGGSYISEDASVLAEDGRIVVLSFMGGAKVHLNCLPLLRQRAHIIFSKLRCQTLEYKENLVRTFEQEVVPLINQRVIVPVANKTYPLEEVAQAHARMEDGKAWGKIVLTLEWYADILGLRAAYVLVCLLSWRLSPFSCTSVEYRPPSCGEFFRLSCPGVDTTRHAQSPRKETVVIWQTAVRPCHLGNTEVCLRTRCRGIQLLLRLPNCLFLLLFYICLAIVRFTFFLSCGEKPDARLEEGALKEVDTQHLKRGVFEEKERGERRV
jgi:NADPH:quinone reductase